MALLAMALHDLGVEAISFTGSQSGILTDGAHSAARIVDVKPERIRAELARGRGVIVAGFQGVSPRTKEITTLGPGGSAASATPPRRPAPPAPGAPAPPAGALAAARGPGRCETYPAVPGVLTADPRLVSGARVIPKLSYRACSALAHLGGRVLHARCVDLA